MWFMWMKHRSVYVKCVTHSSVYLLQSSLLTDARVLAKAEIRWVWHMTEPGLLGPVCIRDDSSYKHRRTADLIYWAATVTTHSNTVLWWIDGWENYRNSSNTGMNIYYIHACFGKKRSISMDGWCMYRRMDAWEEKLEAYSNWWMGLEGQVDGKPRLTIDGWMEKLMGYYTSNGWMDIL